VSRLSVICPGPEAGIPLETTGDYSDELVYLVDVRGIVDPYVFACVLTSEIRLPALNCSGVAEV